MLARIAALLLLAFSCSGNDTNFSAAQTATDHVPRYRSSNETCNATLDHMYATERGFNTLPHTARLHPVTENAVLPEMRKDIDANSCWLSLDFQEQHHPSAKIAGYSVWVKCSDCTQNVYDSTKADAWSPK